MFDPAEDSLFPYPYREDNSIDLVELFNERIAGYTEGMEEVPDTALRMARKVLVSLEQRKPIFSRQVAETAVLMAEQVVVLHTTVALVSGQLQSLGGGRR